MSPGPVLVPVANPASIGPMLTHAAELTEPGAAVHLLTVLGEDAEPQDLEHALDGLTAVADRARALGIELYGDVCRHADAATAVLEAIERLHPSLVVLGWRGRSSTTDVFGRLIDHVVGRSRVPLAVVRLGLVPPTRLLFPVSEEHLLPGGGGSLRLAASLADRIRSHTGHATTILRTGAHTGDLPTEVRSLGDRVHRDPRRTHKAVEAFARPDDLIVAAVAPTPAGLRGATTHLAWAAPDATLLVAVDVGPTRDSDLVDAVAAAGHPAPHRPVRPVEQVRIVVTIRFAEHAEADADEVERLLARAGETDLVMSWWSVSDQRAHLGATVTVHNEGTNAAMGRVMTALHDHPALEGAEITYELDRENARSPRPAARTPGPS